MQGLDVVLELGNLGLPGLDGRGDLAHFASFARPLGAFTGSAGVSVGVRRVDMVVDAVQPSGIWVGGLLVTGTVLFLSWVAWIVYVPNF